ncbi:hypothetical protein [Streptomyces sp. NBC_01565]|uniref:phage tail protein n=1 Tax=Streptomyces sp. NBC_01565 TaxID=2975881 RepID=UPI00225371AE|nr:hypothetical protein [Streptomyces sp. NBC_01565]
MDGTFANVSERIALGFDEAGESGRRFGFSLSRLSSLAGGLGSIAGTIGGIAAKLGAAVPLAANLVAMLANIAPAAGVAVTGLFAVVLASKALKIGMVGVGEAVKAAMDPSNPQAFEEAIKNLAPSAKSFAREVKALQPQFKALQQDVQQTLFQGLDKVLRDMGKHTLPVLRNGLETSAWALNLMAKNVGNAAVGLSMSGTLGQAISGANTGLYNLSRVPSQIVVGLTQVGAAAAPAFARLTAAAGAGADSLSERFSKAFESGGVQAAIENAIGLIGQLGSVIGNVGSILGSMFAAAQTSGGGFIGTLQQITGALATAFASPAVQAGLSAIFQTMATVASTVGPLLTQALVALAPVFTALGPPIQRLVGALGTALGPIIKALGPVLEAAAVAIGSLLDAVSPLLPVIGDLIAQLLPALTPILKTLGGVFERMAPIVAELAGVLMSALSPILAALVPVLEPILAAFMTLVEAILPIIMTQITAFAPLITQLAGIFAQLMVALAPVIAQLILLVANVLTRMTPILIPIIEMVAKLAALFADELARVISGFVVPALEMIVNLLSGDFSGAWESAKQMVGGAIDFFVRLFRDLPAKASEALSGLAASLWSRIWEAGLRMNEGARQKRDELLARIREIPGQARAALGDLGGVLWNAGARLISGLIDGIKSRIGSLRGTLSGITSSLPDWKGPAEVDAKILTPAGASLIEGFQRGITAATPGLEAQLGGLTGALPGMTLGPGAGGTAAGAGMPRLIVEVTGPQEMRGLIRSIVQKTGGTVEQVFGTA